MSLSLRRTTSTVCINNRRKYWQGNTGDPRWVITRDGSFICTWSCAIEAVNEFRDAELSVNVGNVIHRFPLPYIANYLVMKRSTSDMKHPSPPSSSRSDQLLDIDSEIHSRGSSSDSSGGEDAGVLPNSPSGYESSASSSDETSQGLYPTSLQSDRKSNHTPKRPSNRHGDDDDSHDSQHETRQRAWYEFDLAVVLVLISPMGNWLTGGDHIRDLMFFVLLVFYLRQVIEVPWTLYGKSRCPQRRPHSPTESIEDKYRELAFSELRKFELVCLASTTVSPFVGAYLLRYVTTAVLGPESISWFSTGLFVMAAGVRPWSHLVDRLSQRTSDLQDFIRRSQHLGQDGDVQEKLETLTKRIDELEESLAGVHAHQDLSLNYLDVDVTSMKRSIRRHEKRWDELERRMRSIEESVAVCSGSGPGQEAVSDTKKNQPIRIVSIISTAARWPLNLLPTRSLSSSPKDRPHAPRRRHAIQPTLGSQKSGHSGAIVEEEHKGHSLVVRSSRFAIMILYGLGYVLFMPLRGFIRVVSGHF